MNVNIYKSYSNNSKIKEIDKLLSKLPNDLDPKMISQSKMYGYTSHINKRFNVNIINKIKKNFLTSLLKNDFDPKMISPSK